MSDTISLARWIFQSASVGISYEGSEFAQPYAQHSFTTLLCQSHAREWAYSKTHNLYLEEAVENHENIWGQKGYEPLWTLTYLGEVLAVRNIPCMSCWNLDRMGE